MRENKNFNFLTILWSLHTLWLIQQTFRKFCCIFYHFFIFMKIHEFFSLKLESQRFSNRALILALLAGLTVFCAVKNYALCLKNTSQKLAAFAFGSTFLHQIFTECVPYQYTIFIIARCQMYLHVMERSLIWFSLFEYFFPTIEGFSCLKCYISTKLSKIVCLVM